MPYPSDWGPCRMAGPLDTAGDRRVPRARLGVLATCLLVLTGLSAQEPPRPSPKAPTPEAGRSPGRGLDPAKLPPNAVIVISDNPRDALQNVEAVVLSPEEYRKLLDAAE